MKKSLIDTVINNIRSKQLKTITLTTLVILGVFMIIIPIVSDISLDRFITALGVSIIVGVFVGAGSSFKIGWPLARWLGLLGGLIISPFIALLFKDAVSAYYASIMGPLAGFLVGYWTESEEKENLEKKIEYIGSGD